MAVKVLSNIPVVEQFIIDKSSTTNLSKKWDVWKDDFSLFIMASGITNVDQKKALLLHIAGKEVREIYRAMPANADNVVDTYDSIIQKLDDYFKPKKNLSYERYVFKKAKQLEDEDAATYITKLRTLAESCEYQDINVEIRDQFVVTCESVKLRKRLLRENNLTLEKLQDIARREETTKQQASEIEKSMESIKEVTNNIKEVRLRSNRSAGFEKYKRENKPMFSKEYHKSSPKCYKCGENFDRDHLKQCKAIGKDCFNCGKEGHFSQVCRNNKKDSRKFLNKANNILEESSEESSDEGVMSVLLEESPKNQPLSVNSFESEQPIQYVTVKINNVKTKVIVDTGSSIDLIDKETFNKIVKNNGEVHLHKTKKRIHPYASEPIKIYGYFKGIIESKKKITESKIFVVDKNKAGNIIGIASSQNLSFVTMKASTNHVKANTKDQNTTPAVPKVFDDLLKRHKNIFKGHGKLKGYKARLHVDESIQPVYQKMYRYPYHLRKKINDEIKRLENLDIIEKTSGPQDWVSNLVATPKTNGDVRLCLDARSINQAIERETFPIPTLDSVLDDMDGSTIFSKIDLKDAYMQVVLEEESRNITNFHTEFGIYRFKRLCFGINNSFEKFQKGITTSLGHLPNIKFISDDMIIFNKSLEDHLQTLDKLFTKIDELNLKLNRSKCLFGKNEIKFFGVIISKDGVKADPSKIESLQQAKSPQNVKELRSFLGLCTYVSVSVYISPLKNLQ